MSISHDDLLHMVAYRNSTGNVREDKERLRNLIDSDVQAFLQRGGTIEAGVCQQLRATHSNDVKGGTTRRWVDRPPPRSAADANMTRKRYTQTIVLSGSAEGPKPKHTGDV